MMTDTSTSTSTSTNEAGMGSADEQEQVPDIGFSVAELEYLLSIAPGPSADMSAQLLNVAPVPSVDETILTGGAALLARGQLEFLDGGEFKPIDAALVIAYILTNAVRWTSISGASEDAADTGLFIESPHGGVIAQPRTLGTWWFIILDPASVPSEVIVKAAFGLNESGHESLTLVQMISLQLDRTFSFRREGSIYGYAFGATGGSQPDKLVEDVDTEKVFADLLAFIAEFPSDGIDG